MQKKKIFDIIPPKKIVRPKAPDLVIEKVEEIKPQPSVQPTKPKRKWQIFVAILVAIIVLSLVFIKSKAEVEIWPKTETKNFKIDLTISTFVKGPDFTNSMIPGKILEAEGFISEEFLSSGIKTKEGKAKGTIRVYNSYSTYPQPLVATTRFVSAEGKLFRTPKRVVIPGGHYEKGKLIPGEIDIEVVADQPGSDYNIGPSTFSIPGFAGTARYTAFYAKSFEPMTGGFIKEVPQILEEDLEKAEEIVGEKAIRASKENFRTESSLDNFLFLEQALFSEIVEVSPLAKAGQELEKFTVQAGAETKGVVFKKSDLDEFARNYLLRNLPAGKKLREDSLNTKYEFLDANLKEEKLIISLEISGQVYSEINKEVFSEIIKGKTSQEIKRILEDYPEIFKIQVKLWPFWVNKAPFDSERIDIQLRFD